MTTHDIPTPEPTTLTDDPFTLFATWLGEARASEPNDPEAMALSTVDREGRPSARMVLLKGYGPEGFTFYTNFQGRRRSRRALPAPMCRARRTGPASALRPAPSSSGWIGPSACPSAAATRRLARAAGPMRCSTHEAAPMSPR